MSFIVDRGERKLIRIKVVDENGAVIPLTLMYDIRFYLMLGGREYFEFSKRKENITQNGDYVDFEITQDQTSTFPPTFYQLKASVDVNDNRFSGIHTDTQWVNPFMEIQFLSQDETYDPSVFIQEIKFSVLPEILPVDPTEEKPRDAPSIAPFSVNHTTENSASIPYTPVSGATYYEYKLASNPNVWVNNGTKLKVDLTGLPDNYTDEVRVRAGNLIGTGPASDYSSFTTNPSTRPTLNLINPDVNSFRFGIEDVEGLDFEYRPPFFIEDQDDPFEWVNVGSDRVVEVFGLEDTEEYLIQVRFSNAGGGSGFRTYSINTLPPPPQGTVDINSIVPDSALPGTKAIVDRTSIAGATSYTSEFVGNGETITRNYGTQNPFEMSGLSQNVNYNARVRGNNNSGSGDFGLYFNYTTPPTERPGISVENNFNGSEVNIVVSPINGDAPVSYYAAVVEIGNFPDYDDPAFKSVQVGDNIFGSLSPNTDYAVYTFSENVSGTSTINSSAFFSTGNLLSNATWAEPNFENTLQSVYLEWTGGGPSFKIRETGIGAPFTETTNQFYTFENRQPGDVFEVELKSFFNGTESISIFITVQTNTTSDSDESPITQITAQ